MKAINTYIAEKFQVSNDNIRTYAYHPTTKDELVDCIKDKIEKEGFGTKDEPLNLNDIDTSKLIYMSNLFDATDGKLKDLSKTGNFDISDWDVSNVITMHGMFWGSNFNGDLSDWNVSKVENMSCMFNSSTFTGKNGDISDWDVRNVKDMQYMFYGCPLQKNPPKWYSKR